MNFTARKQGKAPVMTAARTLRLAFDRFEYGIYKRRVIEGDPPETSPDWLNGHPVLFPTMLALPWGFQIRTPMDDENTLHFSYNVRECRPGETPGLEVRELPWCNDKGEFILDTVLGTDMMAWITPGAIAPRQHEHLGLLDRGIIEYRQMLSENIARVECGEDPLGVIRDPAKASYTYRTEGDLGGGWRGFQSTPNPGAANNPPAIAVTPPLPR
jgi:5,5'-dehydrodivanillate O-demethylase